MIATPSHSEMWVNSDIKAERDRLLAELEKANRTIEKLKDQATHRININNRLWCAMSKHPGGVEAARSISVEKPT